MQLIEQWLGVDFSQPMEFIIAFVVVMVLIALVTMIIRGIMMRGGDGFRGRAQKRQRLFVGEWVRVDEKRRLLLVRRDDVEHLLLVGGNSDLVVEQDVSSLKPQILPVAAAQPAAQPDVYAPPEEPRIPTADPGYRSPLRTPAADAPGAASAPLAATGAATVAAMEPPMDEITSDPGSSKNGVEPDTKLTGLQAARARIAALRQKSAEMSKPVVAATAGGAAVAATGNAEADSAEADMPSDVAEEPEIPAVAPIDLDEAIAEAIAPQVSIDDPADLETEDVDMDEETDGDIEPEADEVNEPAESDDQDDKNNDDPREDDLAARLHDVLIKPA